MKHLIAPEDYVYLKDNTTVKELYTEDESGWTLVKESEVKIESADEPDTMKHNFKSTFSMADITEEDKNIRDFD